MKLLINKTKKIIFILLFLNLFSTMGLKVYSQVPIEVFDGPPSVSLYVIPHIVEAGSRITKTPNTFDTTISVTYTAGLVDSQPSSNATVDLYLFNQTTGDLLLSKTGDEVCSPCSFDLGPGEDRKLTIRIEDLINEAGGFPTDTDLHLGFAIISLDVPPERIYLNYTVESSQKSKLRTSIIATQHNPSLGSCSQFREANDDRFQIPTPGDVIKLAKGVIEVVHFVVDVCDTLFGSDEPPPPVFIPISFPTSFPTPTPTPKPPPITNTTEGKRIKVLDRETQKIKNTTSSQCTKNNSDTIINLFNQSGIKEWVELQDTTGPSLHEVGQPIDVDLYLFDDKTGLPIKSATNNEVCNPCRINLGTDKTRKRLIRIDDLIRDAGGFPKQILTGFATIVVDGDADNVNVQSFVVNSKSSPLDISRFGFEIDELRTPSQ